MKIVAGVLGVLAAATTQWGCLCPCTEYTNRKDFTGVLEARESNARVVAARNASVQKCEAAAAQKDTDHDDAECPDADTFCARDAAPPPHVPARCDAAPVRDAKRTSVTSDNADVLWVLPGASCEREDCLDFGIFAGDVELRMRQPHGPGAFSFEELGAVLCELLDAPPDGDFVAARTERCAPAHGAVEVLVMERDCADEDRDCVALEAVFTVEEETDLEQPSLVGTMLVRASRYGYGSLCYAGPSLGPMPGSGLN